jgi:hypothetical protein
MKSFYESIRCARKWREFLPLPFSGYRGRDWGKPLRHTMSFLLPLLRHCPSFISLASWGWSADFFIYLLGSYIVARREGKNDVTKVKKDNPLGLDGWWDMLLSSLLWGAWEITTSEIFFLRIHGLEHLFYGWRQWLRICPDQAMYSNGS